MRRSVIAGLAGLLAACSGGMSEGTAPSEMYLDVGAGRTKSFNVSECTGSKVRALLVFTGDSTSVGDFSSRAQWHSNNPETLFVADGVTPYTDGTVYTAGSLLAVRPGAAVITANYLDFTASATVEVRALDSLRIEPQLTDLAENQQQQYELYVRFAEGQAEQRATTGAVWSFPRGTSRAAVGESTGLVSTNSASADTVELAAQLPGCARDVRTRFRVSTVQSLEVGYEQGSELRLPVGFSEAVTVKARFAAADSTLQNVANAIDVDDVDDDLLSVVRDEEAIYVQAIDTEARSAGSSFKMSLESAGLSVQSKAWTPVETDLLRFSISPRDLRLQYPASPSLVATGEFADGVLRPISRHVTWVSDVSSLVVGNGVQDSAGELGSEDVDATAEVTAIHSSATEDTRDSVRVRTYASTSTLPQ